MAVLHVGRTESESCTAGIAAPIAKGKKRANKTEEVLEELDANHGLQQPDRGDRALKSVYRSSRRRKYALAAGGPGARALRSGRVHPDGHSVVSQLEKIFDGRVELPRYRPALQQKIAITPLSLSLQSIGTLLFSTNSLSSE